MPHEVQSRLLILKHGDFQEAVLYRLQKGWKLHFVLDASLASLNVKVFVNHPLDPKEGSNRGKYREVKWDNESPQKSDDYDSYAEVHIVLAGSFNYFFTINRSDRKKEANGGGYFLVDPVLRVGEMDDRMSLNSICCQTVMPKLLGTFDMWPDRLRVSKESGYNMIHFTPVQELGLSDSAYCLKNQRKLDPRYSTKDRTYTMDDLRTLVNVMKNDWEVLSLTDLVYNHTANESPWILENPDSSYNLVNSPHLRPAYLMDRILWHFSLEVGMGRWESRGLPPYINSEAQMSTMHWILTNEVMPKYKFWEFDQCNIDEVLVLYRSSIMSGGRGDDKPSSDIFLMHDPNYRRLKCRIDIPQAIKNYYSSQPGNVSRDVRLNRACEGLRWKLQDLNSKGGAQMMDHVNCAIDSFIANAKWRFVNGEGPRLGKVGPDSPLMWNYFTLPKGTLSVEEEENLMNGEQGAYCMAHNGWVMSDDPLRNFAEPGSNVYLRRELIPWGDSVKLRYGWKPEDSPYLWEYMKKYTVESASIFHGVRLDNCHSTPIHVAEYMLDEARKVQPDLYVIAELFTNSEYADNTFINRLGINSLIREGLNGFNPRELNRLVHRYIGEPIGSFVQLNTRYIMPSTAHALFMDQTHDNESVIHKHTAEDLLPYSSIIAMACSAFGSNRGYDEMVPHYIDVVKEKRLYKPWTPDLNKDKRSFARADTGIIMAKKLLNEIHIMLEKGRYLEAYASVVTEDILSVTRHNPTSHQSVVLFANTSFFPNSRGPFMDMVHIPGIIDEILFEGTLRKSFDQEYKMDPTFINGLDNYSLTIQENVDVQDSRLIKAANHNDKNGSLIQFNDFVPGSVIIARVNLPHSIRPQVLGIRKVLTGFGYEMRTLSSRRVSVVRHPLEAIFEEMNLDDLHRVLFRSDKEERDDGLGFGVYDIPNHGPLLYCGLQGFVTVLDRIRPLNDLGHPLCENVREGNWMTDYIVKRFEAHPRTNALGKWLRIPFEVLRNLPRHLIPTYFDAIVYGVYSLAVEHCWRKMSTFSGSSSKFARDLSLCSLQMCSYVKTAKLPKLSRNISKPLPPKAVEREKEVEACLTLSAGFPHFATGLFRNWGRDTFIAMRGLLLITGRFQEARFIILGYAGTLRHGLIPNLLGEGLSARYNCRDAVWFWLQCIKDYCRMVPNGNNILKENVMRLYPQDDSDVTFGNDQALQDVMQEALQKHATGLGFRERNAGINIDMQMKHEGFNNSIGVNWDTGFVYGGNDFNCGTWMDKMGSSEKAGNKGVPATPRDGAAVELVGLCASLVGWLAEMNSKGIYPHKGVQGNGQNYTWESWFNLMKTNFEKYFWIDQQKNDPKLHQGDMVNKKGIYKDTVGSFRKYTDYQLRCNFPIAMVVCPDLFTPEKAWESLSMFENHLLGPLGAKTLDPSDFNYIGDYYNSDDSLEYKKAKGFNYHQGPEWVWPVGYFFRAKLMMAQRLKEPNVLEETLTFIEKKMTSHNDHLQSSDWKSLPELTNSNGSPCPDSCAAQAWSVGCMLEVLFDMSIIRAGGTK